MVAKGKDASGLFPAVVKNVVCKNLEVSVLELTSSRGEDIYCWLRSSLSAQTPQNQALLLAFPMNV